MRGCGIRALGATLEAAYCACFVEAAETFTPSGLGADHRSRGTFPSLEKSFGDGVHGPSRFTRFLSGFTPTAAYFNASWHAMQLRVGLSGVPGPLDQPAEHAGRDRSATSKLQRAITAQLEQVARDALAAEIAALQVSDPRRQAWYAEEKLSSQWVAAWPTHEIDVDEREFREVMATYLGIETPALRALGGMSIPCKVCAPPPKP